MKPRKNTHGSVRIVGGCWRGTRVPVTANAQLRPTPDRVRETVFNWCAQILPGANCLDLFAGTGVLGFEAVSRGARAAVLVESEPVTVAALRALKQRLAADAITIHEQSALEFLTTVPEAYDVVFVDPPFHSDMLDRVLENLRRGWLADGAVVYIETPRDSGEPGAPWQTVRCGRTREVSYRLVQLVDEP